MLGLDVIKAGEQLWWRRSNQMDFAAIDCNSLTRRELYSLCGKLVGIHPVCGWLRVACGYLKRESRKEGWD
ncbi:MAG: hypothetical protein AAF438_20230, partial [Pseudomonadota bacterium]